MENKDTNNGVYSHKVRAGKRRTYFFDVRATKFDDYYIIITESKKRFDQDGYERHKIFLYKEDFNKFVDGLNKVVNYVKLDLMPNFDFDAFNSDQEDSHEGAEQVTPDRPAAEETEI